MCPTDDLYVYNDVRVEVVTYTFKLSVPSLNASGPMVCIGLSDKILNKSKHKRVHSMENAHALFTFIHELNYFIKRTSECRERLSGLSGTFSLLLRPT